MEEKGKEYENEMGTLLERALHYVECYDMHFPTSGANWVAEELRKEIEMATYPELQEKIRQAIGEASTCWENLDSTGAFDSGKANGIATRLYDDVVDFIDDLTNEKTA